MHEMSIAMSIVNIACKEAKQAKAASIIKIELDVGRLSGVMLDSLKFCYESACRSTLAENASLVINDIEGKAQCLACNAEFSVDSFMTLCPECDSFEIKIGQGRELKLRAVTVND